MRNLNSVRGLACLLLVGFHVVGASSHGGLMVADDHPLRYIVASGDLVRMPLFTILSGILFGLRPPQLSDLTGFTVKKLRRIGLPLITGTTVFLALRWLAYGEAPSATSYLTSYQHLWFLQALLLIFMVSGATMALGLGVRGLLMLGVAAWLLSGQIAWIPLLSVGGALYLMPFFAFGALLSQGVARRRALTLALPLLTAGLIVQQAGLLGLSGYLPSKISLIGLITGCAASVVILSYLPRWSVLEQVGGHSYAIYLWHPIASSVVRESLGALGVENPWILFLPVMLAGVLLPCLVRGVLSRWSTVSLMVTGSRPKLA